MKWNLSRFINTKKYDRILAPFFFVILPGTALHGYMEYLNTGLSQYFFRDVINVLILIMGIVVLKFSLISKKQLIVISLYTIRFAIDYTFIIAYFDPNFAFEYNFIHVQMIFATVIFAAGTLIHSKHLFVLNTINIIFIVMCALTYGSDYSIWRFVFCAVLVSGGGFIAYAGKKFVQSLFKKIKAANILIERQNAELKKMNASKDQLFRIIGHDLKTPFHQLNLLVELITESKDENERQQYANLIKESATKGSELLEDLLDWGKQNMDTSQVSLEETSIAKVVDKTFEFFKVKSGVKEIKLINELPENIKLKISPSMMETVFRNLIGNAIKFSHPKSKIIVKCSIKNNYVDISVEDRGVGISSDQLKILLSEDQVISTSGTANEQGTGYGLGIVKKLVEKQMGSLSINSELEKGTKVILTFPMVA
ncbi:HAMP domain-containing sensor histidine kinase [uncultured Aquimarina sp.]|uniref:sensor histidine kinase n=1 Tax=uncultured Aquimarina sp. TaxID=575652 RepID=UPI002630766C|nr:HAMP domain-containing sensor histidine kinase [uncultured Aquimarina sp.]